MFAKSRTQGRFARIFPAVVATVLLLSAIPAQAQTPAGRGGGKKPTAKKGPIQPRETNTGNKKLEPGSFSGRIIKFEPVDADKGAAKDGKEENLVGELSIRPFEKGGRLLKVKVFRVDEMHVEVGGHQFEIDEFSQILWKGLMVTAEWRYKDAKERIKELKSLTFDTFEIEGEIEKIEDGMVIVQAKPKDGKEWPDANATAAPTTIGGKGRGAPVKDELRRARKLKLKIMEDVTKYLDAARAESDLNEFAANQKIEATIVYGKPNGMLLALKLPWDGTTPQPGATEPARRGGERGNQPPGPQPRGRGSRGPTGG